MSVAAAVNIPPPRVQPATLATSYIAHPDVGTAYKSHSESVFWTTARKRCLEEGAQSAVVDSHKKLEYGKRRPHTESVTHVGIHSLFDEGEWVSASNGAPVESMPRSEGEPDQDFRYFAVKLGDTGLGNHGCDDVSGNYVPNNEITIPKSSTANGIAAN